MSGTVLILGATGRFGRNAAEAFWNAGWRIQVFDRKTDDLNAAAQGVDVILYGWNPPYQDWEAQLPDQTAQVIKAAQSSGATVIFPGNVYVYGEDAPADFGPHLAHRAKNPLGRLRIEMEAALRDAGIPLIILRGGDFLDTEASGNWFDKIIAASVAKGVLSYPGATDVPHAWAYLPDMARAAVMLAEKRSFLPRVSDIAFPGYTLSGQDLADLCAEATRRPVKLKRMAWWPIHLARPFWRMARHLLEMRYLWDKPHSLSPESFDAVLPEFQPTAPREAIARAITPMINAPGGETGPAAPTKANANRPRPTHAARHRAQLG